MIISGAEVFDGSGDEPFISDIGIKDQRIACIGNLSGSTAKRRLDAHGLSVAPGFIDVHTHVERNVPTNSPFLAPNFIRQGVTTIITGNCGRSFPNIGKLLKSLESNQSQVNVGSLIGHNTIRQSVMKQTSAAPSPEQLKQMKRLVDQAMADGALGLSTGLVYIPGTFAKTAEIVELVKPVARNNGLYVSHIRDEGAQGAEAIKEAIEIGKRTGAAVHISHFKAQGPTQWGTARARLEIVRAAIANGQKVSLDQYPYSASSTGLAVLLPSWLSDGDLASAKRKLSDPAIRSRVRAEMLSKLHDEGWTDYSFARIAYCQSDESLVGLNIAEITDRNTATKPLSQHASLSGPTNTGPMSYLMRQAETVIDLYMHGGAQMVFFDMAEEDIETIIKDPDVMFGSDSSVRSDDSSSRPHPRGYGTFPRVLGLFGRDKGLFSMQEAIRRMTSLPAATFGIRDRGLIRTSYWADLVIFERNKILDTATYEEPLSEPDGILYVIVNGSVVLDGQNLTQVYPGAVIRHDNSSSE
ncbi:MAG TPA: D-aminoacylase [Pyrinomonadaceae bacterium]